MPKILPLILNEKLSIIEELCRKYKVKNLWVFGSVLRNDFRKTSDIDFLVSFDEVNMTVREYLDYLFFLKKDLENLFQRKVDLIEYEALKNPYMIEEIDNTKKLIFYGEEQEKVSSWYYNSLHNYSFEKWN